MRSSSAELLDAATGAPVAAPGPTVQLQGSRVARALMRLCGWRVQFDGLPAAQGVLAVYPHTSNWDFVWALLAKWAIGIPVTFWAKDTLFKPPLFGRWLRWLGGRPVERDAPRGAVGQMAAQLRQARERGAFMWLALSPEGTRSLTPGWRTGFYQVALQAEVPVTLAYLDYGRREVGFDSSWRLSGHRENDLARFAPRLADRRARRPELAAPVRFL